MDGNSEVQVLDKTQHEGFQSGNNHFEPGRKSFAERLKGGIANLLSREKKIDGHSVVLDIQPIKHRSDEETRDLREKFEKADVFIPELFGWSRDYLGALRRLSGGEITPEEILMQSRASNQIFFSKEAGFLELIYNSKKPIVFIDVPARHPLDFKEQDIKFPKIEFGNDFNHYLVDIKQYTKEYADLQKEREKYILSQLEPGIKETIDSNPQLREKNDLNILMTMGDAHTLLSEKLRSKYKISENYDSTSGLFFYNEEAMINNMNGKAVNDDLSARILTERLLFKAFKNTYFTEDTKSSVKSIREIVSKFDFDEMRDLYNNSQNIQEWGENIRNAYHVKKSSNSNQS